MRSFENIVRDGRFRVPASGTPLRIGEPVVLDADTPGYLEAAAEAADPGQNCGIVVYEHIQNKSDALVTNHDDPYDKVPLGVYAQMIHGPGAKVWFKNTAQKTLYDGRVRAAVTMVVGTLADLDPGMGLVPAGGGQWRATDGSGTADVGGTAWLVVEQVNATTGLVEARFAF
jgi:hypothetical protein